MAAALAAGPRERFRQQSRTAWAQVLHLGSNKRLETGLGAGGGVGNMELVTLKGARRAVLRCCYGLPPARAAHHPGRPASGPDAPACVAKPLPGGPSLQMRRWWAPRAWSCRP